ncbi:MAG: Asp-tRNA(Asn)/Glu-tRNA(Gln) amidotransferase subunit GatB [Symbiobacteriia bacterium]
MSWETVIGLEIHVELKTESKIFCGCSTRFGGEPNTQVCPVCMGLPGALPVLNEQVLEYGVRAALALGCEIAGYSKFDRKNYFYPDLPKAYQISQFDLPLAQHGHVDFFFEGEQHRVRIHRVHIEEDAGKLLHAEDGGLTAEANVSLADFNRSGVPLIEIVTEPDLRSGEEARAFLNQLKTILAYADVSHLKMEEGNLRADVNVSVRPVGAAEFGTRTEMKNVSSFRAVVRGIEYEAPRQIEVIEKGGRIVQETRQWNETKGITVSLRSKEEAHDYRYFPEPDLPPLDISREYVERVRAELPELPDARRARYIRDFGLRDVDAGILTADKGLAAFFEEAVGLYPKDPKAIANWVLGDLLRLMNARSAEATDIPIKPAQLVATLELIDKGTISGKIAKTVFEEMVATGKDPEAIVKEQGLVQISDTSELERVIAEVIEKNPQPVADFRGGKESAAGFLVGQVMKATRGKANPGMVNELLKKALG